MSGKGKVMGLAAVVAVALVLALSGTVSASGTGYNLSFSQAPVGALPNIALTSLTSTNPSTAAFGGAANVTIAFTVQGQVMAGVINTSNAPTYIYEAWIGGDTSSNATAYVLFGNSTSGMYISVYNGGYGSGSVNYTISNGGSTLSFSLATTLVGPAANFSVTMYAEEASGSNFGMVWLGSGQCSGSCGGTGSGGGGGTGGGTSGGGSSSSTSSSLLSGGLLYALIGIIAVVVIAAVALMLVMRRKRPPTMAPPPMQPGWLPPPQPGMAPPPPQYQPMPPPPPPQGPP